MNSDLVLLDAISAQRIVPIGELTRLVALLFERSFSLLWVAGEISNLTRAASGHWYFVLKDRDAQVRCVMFRNRNQNLEWAPRDGDRVEARVIVGLYAPRGEFQLQVEQMRRAGAGVLFENFLRIKAKLEAEGLFDAGRKRPLPAHPRAIAIVTSLQAAALRDVLTTLARRAPHVDVLVFPTPVQGDEAPLGIAEAIGAVLRHRVAHRIDVLLLVRGGGSIEDLWAYNDERVAYAIAAATMPVISGVGHETDFTIADFVADLRAPTPTAAAELASSDASALLTQVAQRRLAISRTMERRINTLAQRVDEATRRLRSPAQRLMIARQTLQERLRALVRAEGRALSRAQGSLAGLEQRLVLLNPKSILERGYAIAVDAEGHVVRDVAHLRVGERVSVEVARGRFDSHVIEIGDDLSARI